MRFKFVLAGLCISASLPGFSQVVAAATSGGNPLVVGVGFSDYYSDWSGSIAGPTLWVDWNLYRLPSLFGGFGLEAEGRDLNYARTGGTPNLRQDTAEGGLIYTLRRYGRIEPYGKFLVGYGSMDFHSGNPNYKHDSRGITAPGAGVEYRLAGPLWVHGDYEYQFWPDWGKHTLNPQGFTIGTAYEFRHSHE